MKDNRDALDYGQTKIPVLFGKLFIPTLLGLISGVALNLADGIFVGRGVGSDALAAINIAAPLFQIAMGVALMFGSGVSVVASVHLSKGNHKAANINITQAFSITMLILLVIILLINIFPHSVNTIFGGSDQLYPFVYDYIVGVSGSLLFLAIEMVGVFVIRLDGSPNYAMVVNVLGALLNILLDWLFVFPFQMGIFGAGLATTIASGVSSLLVIYYFVKKSKTIHLYKPKFSSTAIALTLRNCGYMLRLGFPTFIAETAICCMMVTGNYVFMHYLHEDGVAAFSVACYLFPMIFMIGNAIAQSSLPIVSYNNGLGSKQRIRETLKLSVVLAAILGLFMSVFGYLFAPQLVNLFIDSTSSARPLADYGVPLFLLTCLPFTLNIVLIGYLQSLERYRPAITFMLLRGYILVIPCFVLLPIVFGIKGLWIAEPVSESLTFLSFVIFIIYSNRKKKTMNKAIKDSL